MRLFSIGYQLPDEDDSTVAIARDYREHIKEVYFALPGAASGRSPVGLDGKRGVDPEAAACFYEEMRELSDLGIDLVLLLNAACYGEKAISRQLQDDTLDQIRSLLDKGLNLRAVTTTSPFVARVIKDHVPNIETRASVNMRIGTVKGMEYLADRFDGYYLQREFNRDFERIKEIHQWAASQGKTLHLLANSGCLNFCSSQSFHDNLVAHEAGLCAEDNVPQRYPSPCWEYIANPEHWPAILQNSWIRPEDIHHYRPYFTTIKLATRMHNAPRRVVDAYTRGKFYGNLLDLTEPGFAPLLPNKIIDNNRFPDDWFEQTSNCSKACHQCSYCVETLRRVLVDVSGMD